MVVAVSPLFARLNEGLMRLALHSCRESLSQIHLRNHNPEPTGLVLGWGSPLFAPLHDSLMCLALHICQ